MPLLQWFEKSVEYKYVLENMYNGKIYPFSGQLETWFGDAIHSNDSQFKLIEFKRSAKECKTELEKIRENGVRLGFEEIYEDIAIKLGSNKIFEKGHYLVYGGNLHRDQAKEYNDNKTIFAHFDLMRRNYWDVNSEQPCTNENMDSFDSATLLKQYLLVLYKLRRAKISSSGDGTFVEVRHEDQALMMTIQEFISVYDHCLKIDISSSFGPSVI